MRLGQTSLIFTASRFASSALGFVATVYFARKLGESVLGQFALILALVSWIVIISQVGLSESVTKRISEDKEPGAYFGAGLLLAVGVTVLGTAGVFVFGDYVNSYVGTPAVLLIIPLLVFRTFSSILTSTLHGRQLVHIESLLQIGGRAVRAALQVLLVVVGWRLGGMVTGYAVASLLTCIVAYAVIDIRPSIPDREHFVSLYEFTKFSWLGNISQRFYGNLDLAVLGVFVTSGLVGIYSVVWSIVTFLTIFSNGIQTTFFPEMSRQSAKGNTAAIVELTEDALMYSGVILIPGLIGATVIGDLLLRIYGPSFTVGTEVFAPLILAAIVWTFNKQLLNAFNAIDRPDLAFRSNAFFVCANVVFNFALISQFGILGAAVATLLSSGIALSVSTRYARARFEIDPPYVEFARQSVAATIMGGIVMYSRATFEGYGFPNVLLVMLLVGIGAGAYFGILFAISNHFRSTLYANIPDVPVVRETITRRNE